MANQFTDGADVTAPASGDWLTYALLLADVGRYLGYGPTSSAWSAIELTEVDLYVQAGVRQFYYPPAMEGIEAGWDWSFLRPTTTIATVAADAAQDLPATLGRVMGDFYYDESAYRQSVVQVGEARLLAALSRSEDNGPPRQCAIRAKDQVTGAQQVMEVAWWPIPDAAYTMTYRYEAMAGKISASNPYPLGAKRYAQVITESCMAIAEQRANDGGDGLHTALFRSALQSAIEMDRKAGARYYGPMSARPPAEVPRHGDTGGTYPITYKAASI